MTFISKIADPKFTFFVFLIYIALLRHRNFFELVVVFVYCLLAAVLVIAWERIEEKKLKRFSVGKSRLFTFILTIGIAVIEILFSYHQKVSSDVGFFVILGSVSALMLLISGIARFKVSAHIIYTGLLLLYFFPSLWHYLLLGMIAPLVGWSRIYLKEHTISQIVFATTIVIAIYILRDIAAYAF